MHWFLMLGDLPPDLSELANEHIRERVETTEHREPSKGKHPHPKLSARNHAASRGEPLPAKRGVRHIRGEAYEARKQARVLEKYQEHILLHRRGSRTLLPRRGSRILMHRRGSGGRRRARDPAPQRRRRAT